ncbi:MAG: alginate O-acetyltransferase AlgX-related protein, partial [Phycisphaerae bacterium]
MAETEKKLTREDIAKIEIGHTDVSRPVAWALILVVLATVFAVPAVQHVAEIQRGLGGKRPSPLPQAYEIFGKLDDPFHVAARSQREFPWNVLRGNSVLLREINRFEDDLEDSSLLQQWLLPPAQAALIRYGRAGNEQAYVGRDDWLFYRPGVDHLTGPGFLNEDRLAARRASGNEWRLAPQPDPVEAIVQFHRQLAARDIRLIVVPTPIKPSIHPEKLSARYAHQRKPVRNPSFGKFLKKVRSAGVLVFDPAEALIAGKLDPNGATTPQYLRTDTHWRPRAMERVAAALA